MFERSSFWQNTVKSPREFDEVFAVIVDWNTFVSAKSKFFTKL